MKCLPLVILILTVFGFHANAQPYSTFRLSTEKPEAGKVIRFVYTGANSKKLDPRHLLYYKKNGVIISITIKGKLKGPRNEGSFILPDSISAFCIKANIAVKPAEVYIFQVYKKGEMTKGAYAEAAGFYAGEPYYIKPNNLQKALSLYRKEFTQHPELKPQYLLRYFASAAADPDQTILTDLERTWQDSLKDGNNDQFLNDLFKITSKYGPLSIKEGLKAKILAKYPQGTLALNEAKLDFFNRKKDRDYAQELHKIETQFPLKVQAGELDPAYNYAAKSAFKQGKISFGEFLLLKIRSHIMQERLYKFAAFALLNSGKNLPTAKSYIQTAMAMSNGSKRVFDQQNYRFTLAQIQHKQGNITAAINSLETALTIRDSFDAVIIYVYLTYLMEAKQYDKAFKAATKYIKFNTRVTPIKKILLESYAKVKGTPDGAQEYYNALYNELARQPVSAQGRMNVKSIDFTLQDIDGKPFTLSKHKGKAVVLYFLTTKHTDVRKYFINSCFNEIASAHQSNKDVLFIGIDNTPVTETNKDLPDKQRLQNVKKYVTTRNFKFKVLLDELSFDQQLGYSRFRVSSDYSVTGLSQFYIIDKKGIVRYRTYANAGDPETFALELSRALKLIE